MPMRIKYFDDWVRRKRELRNADYGMNAAEPKLAANCLRNSQSAIRVFCSGCHFRQQSDLQYLVNQ
jgi:hypothetical protein